MCEDFGGAREGEGNGARRDGLIYTMARLRYPCASAQGKCREKKEIEKKGAQKRSWQLLGN